MWKCLIVLGDIRKVWRVFWTMLDLYQVVYPNHHKRIVCFGLFSSQSDVYRLKFSPKPRHTYYIIELYNWNWFFLSEDGKPQNTSGPFSIKVISMMVAIGYIILSLIIIGNLKIYMAYSFFTTIFIKNTIPWLWKRRTRLVIYK